MGNMVHDDMPQRVSGSSHDLPPPACFTNSMGVRTQEATIAHAHDPPGGRIIHREDPEPAATARELPLHLVRLASRRHRFHRVARASPEPDATAVTSQSAAPHPPRGPGAGRHRCELTPRRRETTVARICIVPVIFSSGAIFFSSGPTISSSVQFRSFCSVQFR
jgi:hypothetical protein